MLGGITCSVGARLVVSKDSSNLRIKPLLHAHLTEAERLSIAVGWPHRQREWAFVLDLGKGLIALRDGRLVGTVMWWDYDPGYSTLGMVIVDPDCQGEGIGTHLMQAALNAIGDRSVMLNASEEGLRLYEQQGFRPIGTIYQYQGRVARVPLGEPPSDLRQMRHDDFNAVAKLDRGASGLDREALLRALRESAEGQVLESNGRLTGYALTRPFGMGRHIGPVIGQDRDEAKQLIQSLLAPVTGSFARLDIQSSSELSAWLEDWGLVRVHSVVTMLRGTRAPDSGQGGQVFGAASQALG